MNEGTRPWYREFWPWFLMLPPALSIAGGVAMVVLATKTPSTLVVEDYARIEELTSERFERDREAARLRLSAEVAFERDAGRIELVLSAPVSMESSSGLILALRHASNPARDLELNLVRRGERFVADAEIAPGNYYLELMPAGREWRLGGGPSRLDRAVVLEPQAGGA